MRSNTSVTIAEVATRGDRRDRRAARDAARWPPAETSNTMMKANTNSAVAIGNGTRPTSPSV